jgi:hypothetical protein
MDSKQLFESFIKIEDFKSYEYPKSFDWREQGKLTAVKN